MFRINSKQKRVQEELERAKVRSKDEVLARKREWRQVVVLI